MTPTQTGAKSKPKKIAKTSVLTQSARQDISDLLTSLNSSLDGLSTAQWEMAIKNYGYNEIVHEQKEHWIIRLLKLFYDPLNILLIILAGISFFTQDIGSAGIIGSMILISVTIRFFQETQATEAAAQLKSMVKTTCSILRDRQRKELPLQDVVPGDIIYLSAGDIIPADIRLIKSKELFINESALTGEALPTEKHATKVPGATIKNPFEFPNLAFMGTHVENGTGQAVVLTTGTATYFGQIAANITDAENESDFDRGIKSVTWLMIKFMAVMVPCVFVINGITKGNWWEALLFSILVAVGLTPAMLPAIVTVNLAKGAIAMSKKKVIIKKLSAIQNFGAMDVLCTDKTGTLTQNKIVVVKHIDVEGDPDTAVLDHAFINSFYQTGFKNLLDEAILNFAKEHHKGLPQEKYHKLDELPFDFIRRRMSVVVENEQKHRMLVCKGAVEEVSSICSHYTLRGETKPFTEATNLQVAALQRQFNSEGFRVIAVASRNLPHDEGTKADYSAKDETDMTLIGFMTFFDPPKDSAEQAIQELLRDGVTVKVLTGDNEVVTQKICREVNLAVEGILLGTEIETMTDKELDKVVQNITIFAKLSPNHKRRIVDSLQRCKHVVGFLGDGINDAPGLKAADVGISVDGAVDIARESADIVLLELNLLVLKEGVIEGRKVFGNIIKYIKMGASSNFGNMFSMLGASLILPFLPMLPIQILINNLLYDISQTAIPTDKLDKEFLEKPRKWVMGNIQRFMLYIGPISSIFDYATFGIMWYVFKGSSHPALFQTGWFVESLLTQTLIIHVIRSKKIPFLETCSSLPLLLTTVSVMIIGVLIPSSFFAYRLGFVHLPHLYWPLLVLILFLYMALTQIVKTWYIKKFGYD